MGSATRKVLSTHYVARVVIEKVTKSGVMEYGVTEPDAATQINRDVAEVGNFTAIDPDLNTTIRKAWDGLGIFKEEKA